MPLSHIPIAPAAVENLGFVHDNDSNPHGIFHDGGGGATQNGFHIQVFADSMTESAGFNFVHNSISYYGHANVSCSHDICLIGLISPLFYHKQEGSLPLPMFYLQQQAANDTYGY